MKHFLHNITSNSIKVTFHSIYLSCFHNRKAKRYEKKNFLTAVLLAVFSICSVDISLALPKGPPPEKNEVFPEKMAEKTAGMLKRDLNLTDDQYKQIYDIVYNYHSSHNESIFDREELNTEIESVLTKEQLEKFEKIKKEQERINKNQDKPREEPPEGKPPEGPPQGKPPQGEHPEKPPRN